MTIIITKRDDADRSHRVYTVAMPTPFTVEAQYVPTFIYPGDEDHPGDDRGVIEASYCSWGVWDSRSDDWAGVDHHDVGGDGQHFDTQAEAVAWLEANLEALLK